MAIIIKDMILPRSCLECPLFNGYGCKATNEMFSSITNVGVRVSGCPLIEVPKEAALVDKNKIKECMVPLDFSVQKQISEVDLDLYVPTIFEEKNK